MKFGEKLSFLRKQRGMTQKELAEKLNISRQAVSRWEQGTAAPSTENLISIGKLFDVSVDELLDEHSDTQDVPAEQVTVEEQKNEPCHEFKDAQVEPVSQEPGKRRFSVSCVFAVVAGVLAVCIIVFIILFAGKGHQESEDEVVSMDEMNQEPVELPEEARITIVYDRQ